MMTGTGGDTAAGGGLARHIPVLLSEVVEALQPAPGKVIIDGTFGAGGYTKALLDAGASVIAIDRDPDAIAAGRAMEAESGGRLTLHHRPFSELDTVSDAPVDGVVLDIGVSSMQIDQAERGFSFRADGPLDMRMAQAGVSAADVVNSYKAGDLARIFGRLGEERHAGRIARMIEKRREARSFETTRDLADAIEALVPRKAKDKIHPATRVFQALRIYINDELGELAEALLAAERALTPGGRLAVVTFHSLEDRIVKQFLAARDGKAQGSRHLPQEAVPAALFNPVSRGVIVPSEAETETNARARSAKLRVAQRTDAPAGDDAIDLRLPRLAKQHR